MATLRANGPALVHVTISKPLSDGTPVRTDFTVHARKNGTFKVLRRNIFRRVGSPDFNAGWKVAGTLASSMTPDKFRDHMLAQGYTDA